MSSLTEKQIASISAAIVLDMGVDPRWQERIAGVIRQHTQLTRSHLSGSDISQLTFLMKNPGSWGAPLDRGEQHTGDTDLKRYVRNGWIEVRVTDGRHGFYITNLGRSALAPEIKEGRRHGEG